MTGRPVRALAVVTAVLVAVVLVAATLPGPSPLTGLPVVAQLVALRGLVAAVALAGAVLLVAVAVALRSGRRGAVRTGRRGAVRAVAAAAGAAVLVAVALGQIGVLAARGGPLPEGPPWHSEGLVVLGLNTKAAVSATAIADLVEVRGADVVSLPETTSEVAEQAATLLAERGLHYQVLTEVLAGGKNPSTSLLVSSSVGSYRVAERGPAATLVATGSGPPLVVVHTRAPVDLDLAGWDRSTRYVADRCVQLPGAIVVGDANATIDHAAFGALAPCVDAAASTGASATGTWPASLPRALAAPIDHVLVDPAVWRVLRFTVIEPPRGTDHRAVEAVLAPATG